MRTVIVICTMILGNCIDPNRMTAYVADMPNEIFLSIMVAGIIAFILDAIDFVKKTKSL